MKIKRLQSFFAVILILFNFVSSAEITLDGTLGSKGALAGPDFLIQDTMGQQVGTNLFHSFESFTIDIGESATFIGPNNVQNVISRVTGGNPSEIKGLIRSTISKADMYFLNPYGITFGKNAELDVPGSFHISTADVLYLGTEGYFNASAPSRSLLTVAPPSRFGFLTNKPAEITIEGSLLQVQDEKTLSITGGDLRIQNGALYAPDGRINLISVASAGEVVPGLSNNTALGTITLLQSPEIPGHKIADTKIVNLDTTGINGGHIFIQGGNFFSTNGRISSQVALNPTQTNVGSITIETQAMTLQDNSRIDTNTFGNGDAGDITITATDYLTLRSSGISSASAPATIGNAGDIQLKIGQMKLQDGSYINSGTLGSGKGGDITITATQSISLFGQHPIKGLPNLIASSVGDYFTRNSGNGGQIHITTPRLELKNRGAVQTGTFGFTSGNAGNILLNSDALIINEFGTIMSPTMGSGSGGNINIFSTDIKIKEGTIISGSVGTGNAGAITITTDTISLSKGSFVSNSAFQASGGDIEIQVRNNLNLFDSGITTGTQGNQPQHNSGNLTLQSPQFLTIYNSQLFANANRGRGGNIHIRATQLSIENSYIDVSSACGLNGQLFINDIELSEVIASRDYTDVNKWLKPRCEARLWRNDNYLRIKDYQILPLSPYGFRSYTVLPTDLNLDLTNEVNSHR